jgi:hypothetical protein
MIGPPHREIHSPHRNPGLHHLSGEIDLELDSGEVVHLKSGDVLLNRGMIHTWVNKGPGGHGRHHDRRQARRGQRQGTGHRFSQLSRPAKRRQTMKIALMGAEALQ